MREPVPVAMLVLIRDGAQSRGEASPPELPPPELPPLGASAVLPVAPAPLAAGIT